MLSLLVIIIAGCSNSIDMPSAGTARLYGAVLDREGNSLGGVKIDLIQLPQYTVVNEVIARPNGDYIFPQLQPGSYIIRVIKNSTVIIEENLTIYANQVVLKNLIEGNI